MKRRDKKSLRSGSVQERKSVGVYDNGLCEEGDIDE